LVYVAAFEPDKGETANQWSVTQPKAPSMRVTADKKGVVFFDRTTFHAGFCADLSKATADFMNASQQPIVGQCFGTLVTEAAWKDKPSYGIVATEDKAINPDIERNMYKRAHTKITEIKGSHAVFISQPEAVAAVIIKASYAIRAYSVKGATTASFLWFVFDQDIKDNQEFRKNKLAMPVLAMGSDHFAPFLGAHVRLVASNVKECLITDSGYWIVQERTEQVQKGLLEFFMEK
jgi:hypothetical protein